MKKNFNPADYLIKMGQQPQLCHPELTFAKMCDQYNRILAPAIEEEMIVRLERFENISTDFNEFADARSRSFFIQFKEIFARNILYLTRNRKAFAAIVFNAAMIAALPLLSLGLGLDDMFVLTRYFMTFSKEKILELPRHEIIGAVLEEAGPGVSLTSFVNSISFGMGAMLPIPGLATFCIGASIVH